MPGEFTRDVDNAISAIPAGVAGSGTLTQDTAVKNVLIGTGTSFRTEFAKMGLWLFFPALTPPLLLEVKDFTAKDYGSNSNGNPPTLQGNDVVWVDLDKAPALGTIVGQSYEIVSANLREIGLLNKGDADAQFDGVIGGNTGTTLPVGQVEQFRITSQTMSGPVDKKGAHWVDATGTVVEVYEQP